MLAPPRHILSKSMFMKGCQYPKAFWFNKHQQNQYAGISNKQQTIFDQGTSLGKLAELLFTRDFDVKTMEAHSYQQSVIFTFKYSQEEYKVKYE